MATISIIGAAVVLIAAVGLLITYLVRKKRLNERFRSDCAAIENGGTPSRTGNHESQTLAIVVLVVAIVSLAVAFVSFGLSLTRRVEDKIQSNNSKMSSILAELREIKTEQKRASRMVSSLTVIHEPDTFDPETMTETLRVEIGLKSVADDAAVALTFKGVTVPAEREGNVYVAHVKKCVFDGEEDVGTVSFTVTEGGVNKSEFLSIEDTDIYATSGSLFYPEWSAYLPTISGWTYDREHAIEPSYEDGVFSIDNVITMTLWDAFCDWKTVKVAVCDETTVLWSQDLTSLAKEENGADKFEDVCLKNTWKNLSGDYVDVVWSVSNDLGYTVEVHDRYFAPGKRTLLPYYVIYDETGTKRYEFT